jgi:RNA polymerase sigma-70 factor (ECF subfamily)
VQEALLAIHTSRHTYDLREPFTPWVHAIAHYKLIDHMRATRLADASLPIEDAEAIIADADELAAAESAADLDTLLAQLPEKMRRAIQCVKIEGLSVAEAARRCGMSESAVKVNVHRGLKALSQSIARRRGP